MTDTRPEVEQSSVGEPMVAPFAGWLVHPDWG